MINLRKNDALADAVKEILQQEALKGNQHLIDKNKNNEVDPEDFKILRGKKKAVKEEETVEEGLKDMVKKAFKLVTGGSDEDQRKNLQGKMGLPQTGKKPTQKEEVEQVDEVSSGLATSYLNKREPQHKPDLNSPETNNRDAKVAQGLSAAGRRISGSGPQKNKQNTVTGRFNYRKNVGATHTFNKEEVQGKTLKQFKEGWDEMLADVKKRGEPQPNGGSGKKQGSAYGGSKQKDKPEQDTEKK